MSAHYYVGDVFDVMAELPDNSVDLILTSPPFLALRSYLPADHPDKGKEIGSEANPAEFVDTLLALSAEWRRLLAPHGSIAVELGDTFSGSGGAGGDYADTGLREGQPKFDGSARRIVTDGGLRASANKRGVREQTGSYEKGGNGWPLAKSLALVPEAYRLALAYGINPHTGETSPAGRWRVRNVIRWVRPNPPVGALGDKFRPATSEMVVAAVAGDRYFDLDAVREPHQGARDRAPVQVTTNHGGNKESRNDHGEAFYNAGNPAGAPPLDWWKISPTGFSGAHYAVWPPELCVTPIKAMCPERVCTECGEPSRRITEQEYVPLDNRTANRTGVRVGHYSGDGPKPKGSNRLGVSMETIGWTDCGHNAYRPGVVLDPFAGTGTTLMVATGHGRDAIGIDIDERNADLARERIGELFLTVEERKGIA